METDVLFEEKIQETTTKKYTLVLFNDDVNTFDYVIEMLVKVCNHDVLQAEQCAFLVHYKGKCAVKQGSYQNLKSMSDMLADAGLTVEIN